MKGSPRAKRPRALPWLASALALVALNLPASAQEARARPRVGLALGGGSAKGIAHVGVLQWLEEHRIPVDVVAGTSMGGLIGGSYATGMSSAEIRELLRNADWDLIFMPDAPYPLKGYRRKEDARQYPVKLELGLKKGVQLPSGLNPGHHIGLLLSQIALPYSTVERFDELPIPFRCTATDMKNAELVVLGEGSLATALRATMAIPGVFDPVRLGDRLLSDGGVLDNVPVDVAKSMGADVVIAVKVGSPKFDTVSESMLGLANRAISLMMEALAEPRLALADVLIVPDLRGVGGTDYKDSEKIAPFGYEAAEAHAEKLTPLSLSPEDWEEHLRARRARIRTAPAEPVFLGVTGVPEHAAKTLARMIDARWHAGPFDRARLEQGLDRIVGTGRYAAASYALGEREGKTGLEVQVREKSYAPPFLNFGIDVTNQQGDVDFNFSGRITAMDVVKRGSELRLDGIMGATAGASAELLLPLGSRGFFVAPRGFFSRSKFNVYEDTELVANYKRERSGGGVDLVLLPGSRSQLRVGYFTDFVRDVRRIGDPTLPETSGHESVFSARAAFDGADAAIIPSRGLRASAQLDWFQKAPDVEGAFGQMIAATTWTKPVAAHDRTLLSGEATAVLGPLPTPNYQSTLGGMFRLGAFGTGEFRGRYAVVGRAGYLRSLVKLPDLAGDRIFLMGLFELGSAFDQPGDAQVKWSATGGLIGDTFFGPIFAGAAVGNGGSHRFYFSIGRVFR